MKAINCLMTAHHQFFNEHQPKMATTGTEFEDYFIRVICSYKDVRVASNHICGTQSLEINNKQKRESDVEMLKNADVIDSGFWVYMFQGINGKFDLANFPDEKAIDKLIADVKEKDRNNTTIFKVRG